MLKRNEKENKSHKLSVASTRNGIQMNIKGSLNLLRNENKNDTLNNEIYCLPNSKDFFSGTKTTRLKFMFIATNHSHLRTNIFLNSPLDMTLFLDNENSLKIRDYLTAVENK